MRGEGIHCLMDYIRWMLKNWSTGKSSCLQKMTESGRNSGIGMKFDCGLHSAWGNKKKIECTQLTEAPLECRALSSNLCTYSWSNEKVPDHQGTCFHSCSSIFRSIAWYLDNVNVRAHFQNSRCKSRYFICIRWHNLYPNYLLLERQTLCIFIL